jgi:cephalosporin-C deacetylase-like acetyl esterase
MRRRRFLQSVTIPGLLPEIAAAQTSASAHTSSRVLLPEGGVKPLTMGIDHVLTELGDALSWRKAPSSVVELEQSKRDVRGTLLTSLGLNPFPERTPLNARVVGRLKRPGYSIDKVVFESRPGFFVTSNVYLPDGIRQLAPAIVCPTGHWMKTGKEDPTHVQPRCIGLVKRGYVVLAYDPIGQGERLVPGNHHSLGFTSFLFGGCNMGWMVWDSVRAIDYLLTRPDVDPARIGITGASGGGANTFYSTAIDERIRAAVPVVFVCTYLEWFRYGGDNCICDHLPGFMARFEEFEIFSLIAPRPMLILNSYPDDGYPVSGARITFAAAKKIYGILGSVEHVDYRELQTPHGYLRPQREAMYGWFDHYLKGNASREAQTEEAIEVEPVKSKALHCFASGSAPGKTMVDFNRDAYEAIRSASSSLSRAALREKLLATFGGFPEKTPLYAHSRRRPGTAASEPASVIVRSETGIALPAFLFPPLVPPRDAVVVYLHPQGKQAAFDDPVAHSLRAAGFHVFAVDLRGLGETGRRPGTRGYPHEFQCCTNTAGQGKPIIGQRVWDVIRALDYLETDAVTRKLRVLAYGTGVCANVALLAAAMDERIKAVAAAGALLSYRPAIQEVQDTVELYNTDASELVTASARIHYSLYIPSILKIADLPDILSLISPRRILAVNPLKADNFAEIRKRLPGVSIREDLAPAQVAHEVAQWLTAS